MFGIDLLKEWLEEQGCKTRAMGVNLEERAEYLTIDFGPLLNEKLTIKGSKVYTSLFSEDNLGAFHGDLCDPEFFDKLKSAVENHRRIMEDW